MYLYFCFDVEDIVHPDSDDIALDIAARLADVGVVASMYVVGEKARLWERRGRGDVIAAVGQHDVGLHTDHHSIHPTVSEYLADKEWQDGVVEAIRQEEPGVRALARIFGRYPSTWATSGGSWGPQIPAASRLMGLPSQVYTHVRAGESGACWFAGQLSYPDVAAIPGGEDAYSDDSTFEAALPKLLEQVQQAQRDGRTCLGIFGAHPTRLRYKVFWDTLNFNRGQNTPPDKYKFAPRRTDAEYQTCLRNLERMILALRDLPGVEAVSTSQVNRQFAGENSPVAWDDMHQLAQTIVDSDSIGVENPLASPAQSLDLLARAVLRLAVGAAPAYLPLRTVLGPEEEPPMLERAVAVEFEAGVALCGAVAQHVAQTGHLPTCLLAGDVPVGPGPLLRGIATALLALARGEKPNRVTFAPGAEEPAAAAHLVEEGIYRMLPGWSPHSPDLRLDRLALHTRLQCWSLKPAIK
ncbi:MAG: hypothetical protein IT328_14990 [Caldilineaceae bacterium]|nr:hypothetical protein [Caldilineaceae bacterium]